MKISMKYALGAAIVWIGLIWILGAEDLGGADILFYYADQQNPEQFITWGVGLAVIAGLYFLFRKNIDD
jgi:hypothetical protein